MERIGEDDLSDSAPAGVVAVTNMTEAEVLEAKARWQERYAAVKTFREVLWLTEANMGDSAPNCANWTNRNSGNS